MLRCHHPHLHHCWRCNESSSDWQAVVGLMLRCLREVGSGLPALWMTSSFRPGIPGSLNSSSHWWTLTAVENDWSPPAGSIVCRCIITDPSQDTAADPLRHDLLPGYGIVANTMSLINMQAHQCKKFVCIAIAPVIVLISSCSNIIFNSPYQDACKTRLRLYNNLPCSIKMHDHVTLFLSTAVNSCGIASFYKYWTTISQL
jgi:hypothetical protein